MPPQIPQRQTTAPPAGQKTNIETADILERANQADFRSRQNVVMTLSQMSDNLMRKSEEQFGEAARAFRGIAELDNSALTARKKSDAQQIVFESKLLLDEQLQALDRDASVPPLELAKRADALIQKESNNAVKAGAALGMDMRDFVRDKMGAYRVEKVPQYRRDGYKKETDQVLAGVEHRNYARQAQMNEPGVSLAKRQELATEMIDEYASLDGTHLSREDTQEKINEVITNAQVHAWYDTLLGDPRGALAMLGTMQVEPEKRASMRSTAVSILNAEQAERDRAESRNERALAKRAKALVNSATNKIIETDGGWNPTMLASNPQAAATFRNGELEGLVRFHNWYLKRNETEGLTLQQAADLADLYVIANKGEYDNEGFKRLVMSRANSGMDIPTKEVVKLITANNTAFNRLEGIDRVDYKENRDRGDALLKSWFDPLEGPFAPMTGQFGAQIRLAEMNARTEYHQQLQGKMQQAKEVGGNPFHMVNPETLALDIISKHLVSTKPMYDRYIAQVDNTALRQAMVPDAANYNPQTFNRVLIEQRDQGKLSEGALKAALSYNRLMNKLSTLPMATGAQPQGEAPLSNPLETQVTPVPAKQTLEAMKAKRAASPFMR